MSHAPWKIGLNEADWESHVIDAEGATICSCEGTLQQAEARAAHIVHCVNVHDQLVAALQKISANAAESTEWIRRVANQALAAAEKGA